MPNWCNNNLTVSHSNLDELVRLKEAFNLGAFSAYLPLEENESASDKWGTKWDVDNVEAEIIDNSISICFDTAWSPPIGFYEELVKLGFTVKASYCELGNGFAGRWTNGFNEDFDLNELSSEDIVDVIGERS